MNVPDNEMYREWNEAIQRGTLKDRYNGYLQYTDDKEPLTFEEWLNN